MKTIDQWLQEAIDQFRLLANQAARLERSIETLSIDDIADSCADMDHLWQEIDASDGKLQQLLCFLGSDVLANPLLGDYQEALTRAIDSFDQAADRARGRRDLLRHEIKSKSGSGLVF